MQALFFLVLFVGLFLLSRVLTETISYFFMRLTKSHSFAMQLLAVLFLPGVIIHELAHWFVASILFVSTGDIEFFPQVQGNNVKLGSVQIAATDPIRRFCIGVAPVVCGLAVLLGVFWFLSPSFFPIQWKAALFFYIVFEIGNTMFSSSKDLEGVIGFIVLAFLFVALLYFLKVPIFLYAKTFLNSPTLLVLFQRLSIFFLFAIGMDVLVIGVLRILLRLLRY